MRNMECSIFSPFVYFIYAGHPCSNSGFISIMSPIVTCSTVFFDVL